MTNARSNPLTDFILGDFLVVLHLNAKPKFSGCLEILSETAVYKLRRYHELEIKSAVGKAELLKPTKCDLSAALPRRSHRTADRGMAGELVHGAGGRAVLSYCSGLVAMAPRDRFNYR